MFKTMTADQVGYAKFAIGGFSTLVIGAAVWWLNGLRPVLDEELCVIDQTPAGHTVLVADISEAEDAAALPGLVRTAADRLPQYHRLSVYRVADLNDTPTDAERAQGLWPLVRVFSACNPGRGKEVNPLLVGARYAEKRYAEKFATPLDEVIRETAARAGSKTSPILGALAQLPNIPYFDSDIQERRLTIRSDLLQHTPPRYTHYAHDIKDLDFALTQVGTDIPRLANIRVEVDFVRRVSAKGRQTTEHRNFWSAYFSRAGTPISLNSAGESDTNDVPSLMASHAAGRSPSQPSN